ncbi:MAG TPA: LamG-like jellyroll fold domain-containing protein [Edaphobacter sp.]|nr:LamG-like jellyroll fold domain-containing protein [Edaphobacter sp.]
MSRQEQGFTGGLSQRHRTPSFISAIGVILLLVLGAALPTTASATPPEPVASYALDENSGEEAHDSTGNLDASIIGLSSWPEEGQATWREEGKFGPAIEFFGGSSRLTIPDDETLRFQEGFTLEAWVYPTAGEANSSLITKEDPTEGEYPPYSYALYAQGENGPAGILRKNSTEDVRVEAPEVLPEGVWSFIALTSDGETLRLYVNGSLVASEESAAPLSSEGPLQIGGNLAFGDGFKGKIDEVRLYDEALALEEIDVDEVTPIQAAPVLSAFGPYLESEGEEFVGADDLTSILASAYKAKISTVELLIDGNPERVLEGSELLLDGGEEYCFEEFCSFTASFSPETIDAAPGPHVFTIRVLTDEGTSATVSHSITLDPRPPTIEVSGPLVEDEGRPLREPAEELSIEATDGLGSYVSEVVHLGVSVDGVEVPAEGLECGWECPDPAAGSFVYDEAEWGSGPHEVTVTATDAAYNEETLTIEVNSAVRAIEPSCPGIEQEMGEVESPVSSSQALEAIEEVIPDAVAPTTPLGEKDPEGLFDPSLDVRAPETPQEALVVDGTSQGGRIVGHAAGGFTIGQAACLVPLATTEQETEPEVLPEAGAALFANSAPETDTLVRPSAMGATVVQSLRGPEAPTSFSWKLVLPARAELKTLSDGSAAVVEVDGGESEPLSSPSPVAGAEEPIVLSDLDTQLRAATSDLSKAEEELNRGIVAVIPVPFGLDSEGETVEGELSVTPGSGVITASVPAGSVALVLRTESAPDPVATCAGVVADEPQLYPSVCSSWEGEATERTYVHGFDWTPGGRIVFNAFEDVDGWHEPGPGESILAPENAGIFVADSDGTNREEIAGGEGVAYLGPPDVSPDGEKIVFRGCDVISTECGVMLSNIDGSNLHLVAAFYGDIAFDPTFSADGSRIYYFRDTLRKVFIWRQLWSMKLDGTDKRQMTDLSLGVEGWRRGVSPSPNGESLIFGYEDEIYKMPSTGENVTWKGLTKVAGPKESSAPAYSPDGAHIVYGFGSLAPGGSSGVKQMTSAGSSKHLLAKTPFDHELRAVYPSYSPDEEEVAYAKFGQLFGVDSSGGRSHLISDGDVSFTFGQLLTNEEASDVIQAEDAENAVAEASGAYDGGAIDAVKAANISEEKFCGKHYWRLIECKYFIDDRALALEMRRKLFTAANQPVDRSTRGNAFQHGFWTALMVRDSVGEVGTSADGLVFSLLHEDSPLDWDAKMDVINDFVGNRFFNYEGHDENGNPISEMEVCESLRIKGGNAIFIGGHQDPFQWVNRRSGEGDFHFLRLIFRKIRANRGEGPIVRPNGRTCAGTW